MGFFEMAKFIEGDLDAAGYHLKTMFTCKLYEAW